MHTRVDDFVIAFQNVIEYLVRKLRLEQNTCNVMYRGRTIPRDSSCINLNHTKVGSRN